LIKELHENAEMSRKRKQQDMRLEQRQKEAAKTAAAKKTRK
jgi:hypothetical protein